MNSIKHRFTLDMHSVQSQISIPASLHDTARTLYINFTDGGTPYHISEGCTALLIISKPSGAKLYEWCAIRDNTNVVYPFSQNKNTASEEGISECEITLYSAPDEDGDIEQIASPRFSIVVSERAINRGDDEILPEASIGFIDQAAKDELVRRQKEEGRVAAENVRVSAETARAGTETARANAESARATAETERASAESARKTAENARASAETARASAEGQRIAAEEERQRKAAEYKAQVDLVREEIETWQDEWGKISSFDKRIENLEAAVSPGLVTPTVDSTVAYSKTVPKCVLPNAAVCEVGGMSYRCENLLDPNGFAKSSVTVVENSDGSYTITNITAIATSASQNVAKKLPAGTYTIKNDSTKHLYIMTSSSDYSNSVVNGSQKTFTYDGTSYLNLLFADFKANETAVVKIMLNAGSTALPYQPYFTGLRDSKVTAVESVGANLAKPSISHQWLSTASIADDGKITITCNAVGTAFCIAYRCAVKAGETYYVKLHNVSGISRVVFFADSHASTGSLLAVSREGAYTATSDATIYIGIYLHDNVASGTIGSCYVMLNKGSTALPYSPYFRESLPIPADALDGFGQGVNAQYCNKIVLDPLEGVKKYVKNVVKRTFTSEANWMFHAGSTRNLIITYVSKSANNIVGLCNLFDYAYTDNSSFEHCYTESNGTLTVITTKTLEEFKALLANNPLELVYPVAPTETDVSAYFTEDNLLRVVPGGTITAANEFEHEVPFTVEYMIKGA